MKRVLVLALLAVSVVLVVVVTASARHEHRASHKIKVVEHATTDAVTNGSKTKDKAGNILTFANKVYNAADKKKVGSDQGSCTRIVVGKSWECSWTTYLEAGSISVQGPFSDTGNTVLAVTGGTGAYAGADGTMDLKYRNKQGTTLDFVFHLE